MKNLNGNVEKLLKKIYFGHGAGGYGGVSALYNAAKDVNRSVSRAEVKVFLQSISIYQRHQKQPKKQTYGRWISTASVVIWLDLAKFKGGTYPWCLVGYDNFTGQIQAQRIGRKTSKSVANALKKMIPKFGHRFLYAKTDRGSEFKSSEWKNTLRRLHMKSYFATGDQKVN